MEWYGDDIDLGSNAPPEWGGMSVGDPSADGIRGTGYQPPAFPAPGTPMGMGQPPTNTSSFFGNMWDNALKYVQQNPVQALGAGLMGASMLSSALPRGQEKAPRYDVAGAPTPTGQPNPTSTAQSSAPPPGTRMSPILGVETPPTSTQGAATGLKIEDEVAKKSKTAKTGGSQIGL